MISIIKEIKSLIKGFGHHHDVQQKSQRELHDENYLSLCAFLAVARNKERSLYKVLQGYFPSVRRQFEVFAGQWITEPLDIVEKSIETTYNQMEYHEWRWNQIKGRLKDLVAAMEQLSNDAADSDIQYYVSILRQSLKEKPEGELKNEISQAISDLQHESTAALENYFHRWPGTAVEKHDELKTRGTKISQRITSLVET